MRIVASEDERKLWKMIKPYLKPEGLALVFDENNAPEDIKQAYKQYREIHDNAVKQFERDWLM